MRAIRYLLLAIPFVFAATAAFADEASFLKSLEGSWTGMGTVRTNANAAPINVRCNLDSQANGTTLSMQGSCRGLLVVSRSLSADLKANGGRYTGVYVGPAGGRSGLNGARRGDTINLAVRWAKPVNGDRDANMAITKVGANGMTLTTIDRNPASGQSVVTSQIRLQRKSGA